MASVRDSDLLKLGQAQSQSLRRLTGIKRHSATAALEVLSGIISVRFRIMDLCSREYVKLMAKCDNHPVKELLQQSVRKGSVFTPLEYIKYISRDLQRTVGELEFRKEGSVSAEHILDKRLIEKFLLFTTPIGNASSQNHLQSEFGNKVINTFLKEYSNSSIIIFSDGSVSDGSVGCGACAAVLTIPVPGLEWTEPVGSSVDIVDCEVQGILLALELGEHYLRSESQQDSRQTVDQLFICCDCMAAIDVVTHRSDPGRWGDVFRRIRIVEDLLHQMNISIKLVWVPGHVGIEGNEQADRLAKETVKNIQMGREEVIEDISKSGAISLCSKLTVKSWQRSWDRCETGTFTRALIPNVTTKVLFPKNRNVGIMYSRMLLGDTMLKDDAFRCGLVDSPMCECNQDRETIDHFLFACSKIGNA